MLNLMYIPLDERPCNYLYPQSLEKLAKDLKLYVPPRRILSQQKIPGNTDKIWEYILKGTSEN